MNIPKLRGVMAEKGVSIPELSSMTNIERSRLYRRFNGGKKFTVEEVQLIKAALNLSTEEAVAIFFN